jgi:anti-sigma B factor antagonist
MAQELGLDISQVGSSAVVAVSGELDLASGPELQRALTALLSAGAIDVAVDLAEVDFVDSHGLGAVIDLRPRFVAAGGDLRVQRPPRLAAKVLSLTDPGRRVPVVPVVSAPR